MSIKKEKVKIYDMTCTSCESRVEKAVNKLDGILYVKASYSGQYAEIEYNDEVCDIGDIKAVINCAGYSTKDPKDYKFIGTLLLVVVVIYLGLKTNGF
jgi:copper chaperone CopZ